MKLTFALSAVLLVLSLTDCHAKNKGLGLFGNGRGNQGNGNSNGNGNGKAKSDVKVKQCNGNKCEIDISALVLDGDSILFELKGNGRKIMCIKSQRGNSGKSNKWVGECEGFGNANIIKRGEGLFGSVIDGEDICQVRPCETAYVLVC